MECKLANINNRSIRYHEWYGGSGLPIILCLHGLGSTSLSFIEIAESLSSEYNVISVDLPGHGMTDGFENITEYTMDNLVNWLDAFVVDLDLKRFTFIAHSYGANIAVHYTIRYEDGVSKLVLLDGGYYNKEFQYKYIKERINEGKWVGEGITSLESESRSYNRLSDKLIFALKDLMVECEDGMRFAARGEVAVGAIKAMYANPSSVYLSKINTPTLLLVSTEPKQYYKLRIELLGIVQDNDNFTYSEVEETSHFLHWDKPENVCKRIREFL